jgi:glycosyltransferase involved in cell wall biosynthesis
MSAPEFSVVVPAYEAEATIGDTVRSVLAQTHPDFELIVVDDGSRRPVAEVVESVAGGDPRVRVIRQGNQGPAAARNAGIESARGRLVGLLDSDDMYMPGYLRAVHAAFTASPEAGLAFTDCWMLEAASHRVYRDTGLSVYGIETTAMDGEELLAALLAHNFITASTVTVRADALAAAGGYDTSLHGSEDYDLWLRIAASGHGAVRPPGCLVLLRDRPGSQSKKRLMMATNHLEVLRLSRQRFELPAPTRQALDRQIAAQTVAVRGFGGASDLPALRFRARYRLARLKTRLLGPLLLRRRAPPEVSAAFPDLGLR